MTDDEIGVYNYIYATQGKKAANAYLSDLEPELDKLRKECAQWIEQEEDVLSYAMFPKVAPGFFEKRKEEKYGIDGKHADAANKVHPV